MRPYFRELGGSLVAYVVLLVGSILVLKQGAPAAPWRELLALAPMLAGIAICWAIVRELRRMDELQMRIQLEALGFAFAGTALVSFSYGFLEGLDYPRLSMFTLWPLMAVLWVVGLFLARRRYA